MSTTMPAGSGAQKRTPFVISEYVRWGDIDLAGIICYGAYIRFYEIAETEIFRAMGLPFGKVFERLGIWLPRKIMHTEFHAPALLDQQLKVLTYFGKIGEHSIVIHFDVMDATKKTLHASAYQVLVCVDKKDFSKKKLPKEIADAAQPYTMTPDEARAAV